MEARPVRALRNAEKDVLVSRDIIKVMAGTFLGEGGTRRTCWPVLMPLPGFYTVYIQVGGDETLLDDSQWLAERARKAGSMSPSTSILTCSTSSTFLAASREADDAIGANSWCVLSWDPG